MNVGDNVDCTKVDGICVYCEKVIFLKGLAAGGVRQATLDHIRSCPKHPLHGLSAKRYARMIDLLGWIQQQGVSEHIDRKITLTLEGR